VDSYLCAQPERTTKNQGRCFFLTATETGLRSQSSNPNRIPRKGKCKQVGTFSEALKSRITNIPSREVLSSLHKTKWAFVLHLGGSTGVAAQVLMIFPSNQRVYPVTDRNVQKSLASRAVTKYS